VLTNIITLVRTLHETNDSISGGRFFVIRKTSFCSIA